MLVDYVNKVFKGPFKNSGGYLRTTSLFFETFDSTIENPDITPIWTTKEHPKVVTTESRFYDLYPDHIFPSLRELYLWYADPSEYSFAMGVFGSIKQWKAICATTKLSPLIDEWRLALDSQIQSKAIEQIKAIAASGGKGALQAAKWLAEQGYKSKASKGRPTKADVTKNILAEAHQHKLIEEDAERVGINNHAPK